MGMGLVAELVSISKFITLLRSVCNCSCRTTSSGPCGRGWVLLVGILEVNSQLIMSLEVKRNIIFHL